jgi:hypothetical protein
MYFESDREIALGIRRNTNTQPVASGQSAGHLVSYRGRGPRKRASASVGGGRDTPVIGSSEQVHVVDALAITGDEGRGSLRKAPGSWQTSFDPEMSEWGNPLLMEYP